MTRPNQQQRYTNVFQGNGKTLGGNRDYSHEGHRIPERSRLLN